MENNDLILAEIREHQDTVATLTDPELLSSITAAARLVTSVIAAGKKILVFGNGGSASDAQHIAAEFTGRYVKERRGLPAIALTTDTSALTAISNDYGFARVFARQVEALAQPGDLAIGISTSGNSENVLQGLITAKGLDCHTLGLTGNGGGKIATLSDVLLNVNSKTTARIQEMHILIGHVLCSAVDRIYE
ncbi:D-sedoheptulose 7-phosphate isomerase [Mucilaginibacter sp. HC2]|jgi:D-sedoheptulose 7-phosphate isomerase|uniref:D-sedoheptulose 7-phosphate isomerase n=2 Tax=Mucilaginibacter TaxID=423349 RepID=UPI000DCB5137|nr:D-sedoheptulose 7-phosphate isomerase [Mucilaginibacter gossypii]NHA05615.1 D-sedoheptulose 7-phosphate isomerase [Mucilaginibacter inviolabilis]QTE40508.1 D-sedoheptulose 7-phosphate isomerase [Mucilaginibacter gossypii]RAV59379.1 phosphoheptose isomerase [Mucilaginibacter rubeus]